MLSLGNIPGIYTVLCIMSYIGFWGSIIYLEVKQDTSKAVYYLLLAAFLYYIAQGIK